MTKNHLRVSRARTRTSWFSNSARFSGFATLALMTIIAFTNCTSGTDSDNGLVINGKVVTGPNVVPITVGCSYANEPCVSVTICTPSTGTCQTIDNILLDTGSYGLRVFSEKLTIPLTNETDSSTPAKNLAECISYGDGSTDWGPIAKADIQLGSLKASNVPMQIINSTFASYASSSNGTTNSGNQSNCTSGNVETSAQAAGFNGILGVGLFKQDCGSTCTTNPLNKTYYACNAAGTTCTGTTVALADQTSNPVAAMSTDNNGVIIELPSIPSSGAALATGYMVLGIDTETNNSSSGATSKFTASTTATFKTTYKGSMLSGSFIDSGSNGLFFPDNSIAQCSDLQGLYCPATVLNLSAVQQGSTGTATTTVSFALGNADQQLAANKINVFPNLGGPISGSGFDWGLPFFLGRNVFVQFQNSTSSLGTGSMWAF